MQILPLKMPKMKQPQQGTQARVMISILADPDTSAIRTAEFGGQEHTVVPVVMLKEGVIWPGNSTGPELALAEEFGRFPESWNGRPIVLNHPKVRGIPVPANSPEILEKVSPGVLFNTTLDGKLLKAELWINNAKVKELGGEVEENVKRLTDGEEMVEVSTGLFTLLEESPGVYEGQKFERIWRNVVPDHLAILPEGIIGACSVETGCGAPRVNEADPHPDPKHFTSLHMRTNKEGPVVNACTCEDPTACSCEHKKEHKSLFQGLRERFQELISFKYRENAEVLSDEDIRTALRQAIATNTQYFWIVAVFNEGNNKGSVVYEDWDQGKLYACDYSINNGTITLASEKIQVRPETRFVPVEVTTNSQPESQPTPSNPSTDPSKLEVNTVDKTALVNALITNEATAFEETDREWLMSLEEAQLKKLEPAEAAPTTEVVETPTTTNAQPQPKTAEQYISDAPPEVQQVLRSGLKLQNARKTTLINGLLATNRCKFTKEQLQTKTLEDLEILAELAAVPDYTGAGTFNAQRNNADDDRAPMPADMFARKTGTDGK